LGKRRKVGTLIIAIGEKRGKARVKEGGRKVKWEKEGSANPSQVFEDGQSGHDYQGIEPWAANCPERRRN